jgi:hypothetical protein
MISRVIRRGLRTPGPWRDLTARHIPHVRHQVAAHVRQELMIVDELVWVGFRWPNTSQRSGTTFANHLPSSQHRWVATRLSPHGHVSPLRNWRMTLRNTPVRVANRLPSALPPFASPFGELVGPVLGRPTRLIDPAGRPLTSYHPAHHRLCSNLRRRAQRANSH